MTTLTGTWRLVKAYAFDAEDRPLPPPYGGEAGMGRVTFNDEGRMMAVLCDGRPTLPAGQVREYNSYCGSYTFDGRQLVTRVDAAKSPDWIGRDEVRDVRFEGKFMVLRPPFRPMANRPAEQRELWWEKIADV
jgi:hypothetical protein